MKYLFFLILFFFSQLAFAQKQNEDINLQGQVPRIEFESTKFSFGDIYRGSVVSHSFPFENTGNGVLVLNSLHAACGCFNTKILAKDGVTLQNVFRPKESGILSVEFDSSSFSGNVVRSVTAETNMGSSSPTVTLTLTANVMQELYSNPALLYIGRMDKSNDKLFTLNVISLHRAKPNSVQNFVDPSSILIENIEKSKVASQFKSKILDNNEPLQIYGVESTSPSIEPKIISDPSSNTQQIQIKINNTLPIGPLNAKLIVWNNSTYYKNFQIPIVGEVVGHVDASAKYVEFGVVNDLKSAERVITYSSSSKDFSVTSVKINLRRVAEMKDLRDSEIFEIKKEKLKGGAKFDSDSVVAYRLHFKLIYPKKLNPSQSLDNSSEVNVSGNFLVKTNDPDYKEITVPFFGVLRKGP